MLSRLWPPVVGAMILLGFAGLVVGFVPRAVVWLAKALQPLTWLPYWGAVAVALVAAPLALFQSQRNRAGRWLLVSSRIQGPVLWITCVLLVHLLWGNTAVVLGLVFGGLLFIPAAIVGVLVHGGFADRFAVVVPSAVWLACKVAGLALLTAQGTTPENAAEPDADLQEQP